MEHTLDYRRRLSTSAGSKRSPTLDLWNATAAEKFRTGQGNTLTYTHMLRHDTGLELDELRRVALNRDEWRNLCHRAT